MDYGKIGKRLEARAGTPPKPDPDGEGEGGESGDSLEESFTPKQADAIRKYVKACMEE